MADQDATDWSLGDIPVPLVVVDVDDGSIVTSNEAFHGLLGRVPEAGERAPDLLVDGDLDLIVAAIGAGDIGASWISATLRRAAGGSAPIELVPGRPLLRDGRNVSIVGVRELASAGLVDDLVLKAHDVLGEGLLIGDGQRLLYANVAACGLYGRSLTEMRSSGPLVDLLAPGERDRIVALIGDRRSRDEAPPERYETVIERPDGTTVDVEMSVKAAVRGRRVRTMTIVRDISDRRATTRALARLALEDPLTGLPNRRLLVERIAHALARGHRTAELSALLFLDLDRFKAINDEAGHAAGDEVLREVAVRLQAELRPGDTVARLGGDEFVVLAESVTGIDEVHALAARLQAAIGVPMQIAGTSRRVAASVGVQAFGGGAVVDPDPEELLGQADAAMYRAKLER